MLSQWRATGNDGEKLADALERLTTVLVEHLAELTKELLAQAPPPARVILPRLGPRLYASRAKRVYATPTPPRIGA
ncbi:hypothetical protein [Streptomyces kaempferi]|uniref:Transposase n=1 Tax=Streptomyces kaempferi TaxID=333725 RepID=A0ABW3XT80_9ACTN